jgi:hypothetical protein
MMILLRMLSNEVKFSPKQLQLVCRTDSATLIQDMIVVGIFDQQVNRGLFRHAIRQANRVLLRRAVRTGDVAVANVLLSLTPKPKNADNLIHLAIKSGKTSLLKTLIAHNLQIKPSHCLRVEAVLALLLR